MNTRRVLRREPLLIVVLLCAVSAVCFAQDDIRLGTLMSEPRYAEVLAPLLEARRGATAADAALYADAAWRRAERGLDRVLRDLERDQVDGARERAPQAIAEYRLAHADALKSVLLAQARNTLRDAQRSDLARRTPLLLSRAQQRLRDAEATLERAPQAADEAVALAQASLADLAQAQVLATTLRDLGTDGGASAEAVLLSWTDALDPLYQLLFGAGERVRMAPEQAGDPAALTRQLERAAAEQSERLAQLQAELDTRNALIRELQSRLAATDSQLDDVARARNDMARQLELQAKARERLRTLRSTFAENEAELLQEGSIFVLRLTGFAFAVGGTEVRPDAAPLLDKVADAIRLFPASTVVVEGHTDATGDAATNLRVSRERAASVREALLTRTGMAPSRMTSRGEGEARPVASNELASGRERNRRIEVRIDPREVNP